MAAFKLPWDLMIRILCSAAWIVGSNMNVVGWIGGRAVERTLWMAWRNHGGVAFGSIWLRVDKTRPVRS